MGEARVRLRPITEADLPDYVRWLNDPEVREFAPVSVDHVTMEFEREWLARMATDDRRRIWAIDADGCHIGNCALYLDESGRGASFGITIGDKTAWGKGYGTAALREVLRIAFEEMGLHRVHLTASADNARAIRCYEKAGFRHEGLRRKSRLNRGEWLDEVIMAILREEWEELQAAGGTQPGALRRAQGKLAVPHEGHAARKPAVEIRGYRPTDYEQVAALWTCVGFTLRTGDSKEALDRKLARDPDLFLVAELDGRVVGTALGSWDGRWAWINRVAVDPSRQRQGIGRRLMAEVEKRLAGLGARRASLLTGTGNAAATRFYESHGYQAYDDVIFMGKDLSEAKGGCR